MKREKWIVQTVIRDLLDEGQEVELPVFGLSMFPFLLPGTAIRLKKAAFSQLRRGDIVFFERQEQMVLHRVIIKKEDYLQCKGDSLMKRDPKLTADSFFAKMTAFSYRNKWLDCTCLRFRLFKQIMLMVPWGLGCFLHPLSFVWYRFSMKKSKKFLI